MIFLSDINNFKSYVNDIKLFYKVRSNRKSNLNFNEGTKNKRSIYVSKNIEKGEYFNSKNLKIIRHRHGAHPKYYDKAMVKKIKKKILCR